MDKLKAAAQFYKDFLLNRQFRLRAGKNKKEIEVDIVFAASNFKHLLGLHKLTDIPSVQNNTSSQTYRDILNDKLTYETVAQSKYFSETEQRIEHFEDLYKALHGKELMLKSQHGLFNSIEANFMLTKSDENYGYAHLFLRKDDSKAYTVPVTYIVQSDNSYLKNNAERWTVLSVEEITKKQQDTNVKKNEKITTNETRAQSLNNNTVRLIGELVNNPSMQEGATAITQYDIEVNTNGRRDMFHIASFDRQAQTDAKCLKKGNLVMIDGNMRTGHRLQNGVQIPTFRINASSVKYLIPKPTAKVSAGNVKKSATPTKNNEEQF